MIQNGKRVFFFISAFLLLDCASLGMNKEEGFFTKFLRKITISSKEDRGSSSNKKSDKEPSKKTRSDLSTSHSEGEIKMNPKKKPVVNKVIDLEGIDLKEGEEDVADWEVISSESSEEESINNSMLTSPSEEGVEMRNVKKPTVKKVMDLKEGEEEDIADWELVKNRYLGEKIEGELQLIYYIEREYK